MYLVFIPFLAISTFTWGVIAALIASFSPRIAFHCGTIWAWTLCKLNFTSVKIEGREKINEDTSYIIMCNHQSLFDVLAFYGHWARQFRWVMKESLRKVPGLGWYCSAGGHIFIDRTNREKAIKSLKAARPLLKGGISVLFFPEGTRSKDGRLGKFKKGGFMMAIDLGLPILPISISGSKKVLPSHTMRLLPGKIKITVHDPIDVSNYGIEGRDSLMEDVRKAIASGLPPDES